MSVKNIRMKSSALAISISLISLILIFFAHTEATAGNAGQIPLRQMNQERERLIIKSKQLLNTVREEMRYEALRNKNRLMNRINDLEGAFSPELFEEILTEARWVGLVFGTDIEMMGGYFRLAEKIIAKAEPLQTLRESYGVTYSDKKGRTEDIAEFRRDLQEKVTVAYLRYLLAENPDEAVSGFRSYTEALRKLQAAEQFKTEAEVMEVTANQDLIRELAGGVPLLGDAMDMIGVATGEDAVTGEKFSSAQRSLDALLILVPEALEKLLARYPGLAGTLKKTLDKLDQADSASLRKMAALMKRSPDDISVLKNKIRTSLEAAESRNKKTARDMIERFNLNRMTEQNRKFDQALEEVTGAFDKTPEGIEAKRLWEAAEKQGRDKVAALDQIVGKSAKEADGAEALAAYSALRQDKRALTELQSPAHKELRHQIQHIENKLFTHLDETGKAVMGKVDADAIDQLKKGFASRLDPAEMAAIRKKAAANLTPDEVVKLKTEQARERMIAAVKSHGAKSGASPSSTYLDEALDFDNMQITVFNATNKPPERGKIGFDRDITYQAVIPEKKVTVRNPQTEALEEVIVPAKKIDIPAELVEEHYHASLYKNIHPGRKMPSRQEILAFGSKMDHQVTDGLHKDAYRVDLDNVTDFFKDPTLLAKQGVRVEDFSSTVTYKSQHWFEMADKAQKSGHSLDALAQTAEGMRQAGKQYDNYMTKLLGYQGLNAVDALPERLQKGMHIFKSVGDGKISVPQAEAALKAINMSKEEVVQAFGQSFESTVKLAQSQKRLKDGAAKAVRKPNRLSTGSGEAR